MENNMETGVLCRGPWGLIVAYSTGSVGLGFLHKVLSLWSVEGPGFSLATFGVDSALDCKKETPARKVTISAGVIKLYNAFLFWLQGLLDQGLKGSLQRVYEVSLTLQVTTHPPCRRGIVPAFFKPYVPCQSQHLNLDLKGLRLQIQIMMIIILLIITVQIS